MSQNQWLKITGVRSKEDLIEQWLKLNPKDVANFDPNGVKNISTEATITFDFDKEEYTLSFEPLK